MLNSVHHRDDSSSSSNDDDGAMHRTKREKKKKAGNFYSCFVQEDQNLYRINFHFSW